MRKFCIKTLLFLLPIVFAAALFELALRNIPNDYSYKADYLEYKAGDVETLVLGSSHSYFNIDPAYFTSPAFSAAYSSQSLDYDYEILKKYNPYLPRLSTVILSVSYSSLFGNLFQGIEAWREKDYVLYYRIGPPLSVRNTELFGHNLRTNLSLSYKYYIRGQSLITCSDLGWGTVYQSVNGKDLPKTGITAAQRHTKDITSDNVIRTFEANKIILDDMISFCQEHKIRVILLTAPAYRTYRELLDERMLKATYEIVDCMVEKYPNSIYLNMLDDPRFVAEDFYDADHLNEIGAQKLSLILNEVIESQKEAVQ